jgi:hypothetical protein
MKKLTLSFLASLAFVASSFGGQELASKEYKQPVPEPCFREGELQLDVFGSYNGAITNEEFGDGFGGGVGVNYFFTRMLGISVSGNVYDGHKTFNGDRAIWHVSGDLVVRFPIEGDLCIAPYILGGGGIGLDGTQVGTWEAGGGLEWRVNPGLGVFAEGRYIWAASNDTDSTQTRVGVRFVF